MNIVFIVTGLRIGGAERVAVQLANYLSKSHNLQIVQFDNNDPMYTVAPTVKITNIHYQTGNKIFDIYHRIKHIRKIFIQDRIDIALCFSLSVALYSIIAGLFYNKTKVISAEHTNPYNRNDGKLFKLLVNMILPLSDGVVFLTSECRDYFNKRIRKKSYIIPNPITVDNLPLNPIDVDYRDKTKITSVGSLRKVKDFKTLLLSFKLIKEKYNDKHLYIYGEGEDREKLINFAKELHIEDATHFMGNVDDIYSNIKDSYLYIQTSISESWGCSIQEALACGLPVISTDCNFGPRKMIVDGKNGFLVPIKDYKKIAEKADLIYSDESLTRNLSSEAVKIREKYSIEIIAKKYIECFMKVGNYEQ